MADASSLGAEEDGAGPFASPPEPERPQSPPASYGVPAEGGVFVPWEHVSERLREAVGYWIGTVTRDGRPHVVPIWGVLVEGHLYLETGAPDTVKNHNLARNHHVVVHLDGVDDTVIVRGTATAHAPDPRVGELLAAEFRRKYPGYAPEPGSWKRGGLVLVQPDTVLAWTDMPTATRWRFTR
jgi:nitroimidazol reductase NimA-like FMN-containing flavoprotein (pyridoxamine 5'-phosphate oxidase superfamily)